MQFIKKVFKQLFGDPCIGTTPGGVKIYVRGAGVAYVDPDELMRSEEVQQLLKDLPKLVEWSRRHLPEEQQ